MFARRIDSITTTSKREASKRQNNSQDGQTVKQVFLCFLQQGFWCFLQEKKLHRLYLYGLCRGKLERAKSQAGMVVPSFRQRTKISSFLGKAIIGQRLLTFIDKPHILKKNLDIQLKPKRNTHHDGCFSGTQSPEKRPFVTPGLQKTLQISKKKTKKEHLMCLFPDVFPEKKKKKTIRKTFFFNPTSSTHQKSLTPLEPRRPRSWPRP